MSYGVALFQTTSSAMQAQKVLISKGYGVTWYQPPVNSPAIVASSSVSIGMSNRQLRKNWTKPALKFRRYTS